MVLYIGEIRFAYFWKCMEQFGKVGDIVLHAGGTKKCSSMGSTESGTKASN
jgi:hypothetical protein